MSAPLAADVQTSPAQVHGAKVVKNLRMCKKIAIFFRYFQFRGRSWGELQFRDER